ncbi:MAG: hypothetical protein ACOCU8_01630 [Patescibacteria group bacterium]
MFLWNHLESWRLQPKKNRQVISLFLATIFTFIIIVIWLTNSWLISIYTDEDRLAEHQSSVGIVSQTVNRVKNGWQILWGQIDNK